MWKVILIPATLFFLSMAYYIIDSGLLITKPEIKEQNRSYEVKQSVSSGNYHWNSGFRMDITDQSVNITVFIKPIFDTSINANQRSTVLKKWESAVETAWSHKFAVVTNRSIKQPIIVNVIFSTHSPHHTVIIKKKQARVDEYNWGINTAPNIIAHEFGHMLGAYDEYKKGALSPANLIRSESLMGNSFKYSSIHIEHLWLLEKWYKNNIDQKAKLIPIH